ncbi:hypothetical protein CK203_071234 [Vitis vinifera]|uniref:Uncharacterized protein n=1 Tax=Vitis vinifera TaxID=29760 RepID=A0A438DSM8_VITVI|nr:hypothetical protein CK203_071234 [Vitis vinifera]
MTEGGSFLLNLFFFPFWGWELQESSITNPQEADWLKYSPFWPDPDNPDHHG